MCLNLQKNVYMFMRYVQIWFAQSIYNQIRITIYLTLDIIIVKQRGSTSLVDLLEHTHTTQTFNKRCCTKDV